MINNITVVKDFEDSVKCFIADKPECNINFVADSVSLPYLNTTQVSVKSEGKCLKVSFANFCSEYFISIETENITCPVGRA